MSARADWANRRAGIAALRANPIGRMLASASVTAVLQGASLAMGFGLSVLLARFLGSRGYGVYALALAWAGTLTIPAILGLDRFLVRGIAVYEVQKRWPLMKGLLQRTSQLVLLSSMAIAAGGVIVAFTCLAPSLRGPFAMAMLLVPLTALTLIRQGAMQAIGRVVSGQLPEYLIRPTLIVAGVLTLRLATRGTLTATTALAVNVAGVAVAFFAGASLLRHALPSTLRSIKPAFLTSEWLRASLPMMLIGGVWMTNNYTATLMVGTIDGPRAAGVYNIAQRGTELIVMLLAATNMPLAPAIARLYAHKDRQQLERTVERIARATLLASVPVAAFFIALPKLYLGLFGKDFRTGATALVILALGQLVNAATGPSGNVLLMTGHERAAARAVAAGLLADVILAFALVPSLGVTGGAIAFASSITLSNVLFVSMARRLVGVNVTAFRRMSVVRSEAIPVAAAE